MPFHVLPVPGHGCWFRRRLGPQPCPRWWGQPAGGDSLQVRPGRATHMQEGGGSRGFPPPDALPSAFPRTTSNSQKTYTCNATRTGTIRERTGNTMSAPSPKPRPLPRISLGVTALLLPDAPEPPTAGSRPHVLRPPQVSPVLSISAKEPRSEALLAASCHMDLVSCSWNDSSVFPRFPRHWRFCVTSRWFWRPSLKLGWVAPPGGARASLPRTPHRVPARGSGFAFSRDR